MWESIDPVGAKAIVMRDYHRLNGIQNIIAFLDKEFSVPYTFKDPHTGKYHYGKMFVATMIDSRGDIHIGKIKVAMEGKKIYHAMFHEIFSPAKDFFENMEGGENTSGKWDISKATFTCEKINRRLELKVGSKANDQVTFLISFLNEKMRKILTSYPI